MTVQLLNKNEFKVARVTEAIGEVNDEFQTTGREMVVILDKTDGTSGVTVQLQEKDAASGELVDFGAAIVIGAGAAATARAAFTAFSTRINLKQTIVTGAADYTIGVHVKGLDF